MKLKSLTSLAFIALLLPALAFASRPSEDTVQSVQDRIQALKENPESEKDLDELVSYIETVPQEHGVDGVAWLAYQEPVLLEAFISPQSFGLENISISLLSHATDQEELTEMIYALVLAQLYMEQDPESRQHMEFYKEGVRRSAVSLSDTEIEQLVVQAVVASIEKGTAEVQAAHANHARAIRVLERIKAKLIAKGKTFLIPIIDRIISRLRNH